MLLTGNRPVGDWGVGVFGDSVVATTILDRLLHHRRHRGNADVVRQDLERELGLRVSPRTVERSVAGLRQELRAEARATPRFETPPGHQLQIDFGETSVAVGGERVRLYLFVATLGYSRRVFVQAFRHERQSAWLDGLEAAFRHFGGVPGEVLLDNARALVDRHDAATREVSFNDRLLAFARYWGFRPRACAPYRARTKGKDERGVGLRQRQCDCRPPVHQLGGARSTSCLVDARDRRSACPWQHGREADRTLHSVTRRAPCAPSMGGRPSGSFASWCGRSRPTAWSSSTPTPIACLAAYWRDGGSRRRRRTGGDRPLRHRGRRPW